MLIHCCFVDCFLCLSDMKKERKTVEDMIMRFHYFNAPDIESGGGENMSGMERQTFIETINDLKGSIDNANLLNKSLQATVESFSISI